MDPSTLAGHSTPADGEREERPAAPVEHPPDRDGTAHPDNGFDPSASLDLSSAQVREAGTEDANGSSAAAAPRTRRDRAEGKRAPAVSPPAGKPQAPADAASSATERRALPPPRYGLVEMPPAAPKAPRTTLAFFCYEDPSTPVGRYVGKLVQSLAGRETPVHLFSRFPFDVDLPNVSVTAVGGGPEDNLLTSVEEYTRRACAAFAHQYPRGAAPTVLFGQEWSTFPALSRLGEQTGQEIHASLHSLERQRSDMKSDLSRRIDEIEAAVLRQARTLLIHDAATGEVARLWLPECGPRLHLARQSFPTHKFNAKLDPGAIKARYQIGPVDPTILFVGNLDERHGPDVLMKSVPAVVKNHPQARFAFVGDGTLLWPLRVYVRYLNLEGVVRLLGHLEGQELYDLVQASDVVAVPSRAQTEWWPFQAAWAAGRPVVATHPLAGNILEHQKDCVLVYPHESSVVWGIERVLYDGQLRQKLTENGASKLDQRFGFNCVAEQLEELLGVKQPV